MRIVLTVIFLQVQEPFLQHAICCLAVHFKIYDEDEKKIASPETNSSDCLKSNKDGMFILSSSSFALVLSRMTLLSHLVG